MDGEVQRGPVYDDHRGRLVPVEFAGVSFVPQRVFVVVATRGAATRGGHDTDCRELLVLVDGSATITVTSPAGQRLLHRLDEPGHRVAVETGVHIDYVLHSDSSSLLVLADRPFGREPDGRER